MASCCSAKPRRGTAAGRGADHSLAATQQVQLEIEKRQESEAALKEAQSKLRDALRKHAQTEASLSESRCAQASLSAQIERARPEQRGESERHDSSLLQIPN